MIIELGYHGSRGILYPQYESLQPWSKNQSQGEITNTGFRQQYLLGRYMRELFIYRSAILREKYDDYQIVIKAAPFNAPIASAKA